MHARMLLLNKLNTFQEDATCFCVIGNEIEIFRVLSLSLSLGWSRLAEIIQSTLNLKNWAKQKVDNLCSHRCEWVSAFFNNNYACTAGDKNACESIFLLLKKKMYTNYTFWDSVATYIFIRANFILIHIAYNRNEWRERWDDTQRRSMTTATATAAHRQRTMMTNCSYYAKKSFFSQIECGREWDTLGLETLAAHRIRTMCVFNWN